MFNNGNPNVVSVTIMAITLVLAALVAVDLNDVRGAVVILVLGALVAGSPRVVQEWERGVLLRLGQFRCVLSPGITWIIPGVDQIVSLVDMRVRSTSFSAEKTLTKDTVPVDVDAVLFWVVTDAQQAVLEVANYQPTVSWASQTALRDIIGQTELGRMISDRRSLDEELQKVIDAKTSEWGITVQSVELRDVRIPGALEDAMSRKAQAERERDARIILAESEQRVAEQMIQATRVYQENKLAMQLRAMNMTYESIKERGTLMVIPSGMAGSMDPGVFGLAAMGYRAAPSTEKDKDA